MTFLVFFALLTLVSAKNDCTQDTDIFNIIFAKSGAGDSKPETEEILSIEVGFNIQRMNLIPHSNAIHLDGFFTKKWTNQDFYYAHQNPCSSAVSIMKKKEKLWVPEVAFVNGDGLILHRHSIIFEAHKNGTLLYGQRIEENIPCTTDAFEYPWGNTTCIVVWRNENVAKDSMRLTWDTSSFQQAAIGPQTVGDLEMIQVDFSVRDHEKGEKTHDELVLAFFFKRINNKTILLFFVPSVMFIAMSWLSLLLGPMVITRAILVVGSMTLLNLHYYMNMAGLPATPGITSLDIWKIFSLIFVFAVLIELVSVSCMASIGRSRRLQSCCRSRTKKGKYEMEPLYEELNDLRQRKTRRTSRCCRYSALAVDTFWFFAFLFIFLVFVAFFWMKSPEIVRFVSNLKPEHIEIPNYFQ
ncbi:unnamed protein product, partial [Mesorhabditis belari]|uniref:Neurotransmitter-gated ion-channel ligand-binding domain-containing protein n=1 Tax=Mesorhabditis belari TaxID=2138241 RepID=A0AAF3EID9_9BILA